MELRCPYCGYIGDECDFPDFFVEGDDYSPHEQVELLHELWKHGFNIVSCGMCGDVFIHKIKKESEVI